MSWNIKKAGTLRDALKAAVQAEHAPQEIKDEILARVDGLRVYAGVEGPSLANALPAGRAIVVDSHGHLDPAEGRPWNSVDEIVIRVYELPLVSAPLA